ncbi:MAG: PLP-dependent aspartate aminotransferase family protein [bacterium]|nr:PLP-dependent aspartate aminotransferase family protein [bacterium]
MSESKLRFETLAVHAGEEPDFRDGAYGDVAAPIHLSSTFARRKVGEPTAGLEYSRSGNPTRHALETKLAALEVGKFALAFASGLAAETTLLLALVKPGDHIVAFDDLYGGTGRIFRSLYGAESSVEVSYVDASNTENVKQALRPNTRIVWMESPTNPLLKLCDIAAIAQLAHSHGALLVVDNTFMSPYLQNPLALGADIVVHSTTKYINGHSDSVGGALIYDTDDLDASLRFSQNAYGAILSPFDSYLVMRGLKTLGVRMRQHESSAMAIAQLLDNSPKVRRVFYPGLASHPQHTLAQQQAHGFGGMLSFELDGDLAAAHRFLEAVRIFALAESLGGVESLIEHPALMTHASVPPEMRAQLGISDTLIRISAGIEHIVDLISDIEHGLAAV